MKSNKQIVSHGVTVVRTDFVHPQQGVSPLWAQYPALRQRVLLPKGSNWIDVGLWLERVEQLKLFDHWLDHAQNHTSPQHMPHEPKTGILTMDPPEHCNW